MRLMGTFSSFTTARLGIYASQQALNVTGHNISNINTNGYTRQRLDQMALASGSIDRFGFKYNAVPGTGVLCTGISQIRDPFLDIRYRNEAASVGALDAKLSGLEDIANILDEVTRGDGSGVLEKQFNDLITQIQNLSSYVGAEEFDTAVRASAYSLTSLLNSYAGKLETVYENQVSEFKSEIDSVNTILQQIGDLNNAIMKSDIHGNSALELRDQRNLLIDELSQYTKITVEYNEVSIGLGETTESLTIYLGGTQNGDPTLSRSVLVDGKYYTELSVRQVSNPNAPPAMIDSPNYEVNLAGLTDSKGNAHSTLNTVVQLGDNDLYGALQSIRETLTESGEYVDSMTVMGGIDTQAASKRGTQYYMQALDHLALKLSTALNEANTGYLYNADGVYVDADGNTLPLFGGAALDKNTTLTPAMKAYLDTNGVALGGPLFSNNGSTDNTANITASNITISKSWSVGDVHIVNSFQMTNGTWNSSAGNPARPGTDDTLNIEKILNIFYDDQEYRANEISSTAYMGHTVYFKGTFQEMLTNINSTLANDMNTTTTLLTTSVAASNELATSRDSVSGVDLNDESVNLMQYQKSYSAACRLMTTMDEALERLINNTGLVGR